MKRPGTPLASAFALFAILAAASGSALAQQQTFSSVSSGKAPSPRPTQTGVSVPGVYLGIYPNGHPYHPRPRPTVAPRPCPGGHCPPPVPPPHPLPTTPVTPVRPAPTLRPPGATHLEPIALRRSSPR